jgi:histidine ammonia-lyase
MTIVQAIDYLNCQERLSPITQSVYADIRSIFPMFKEDLPKYKELQKIRVYLEESEMPASFNE